MGLGGAQAPPRVDARTTRGWHKNHKKGIIDGQQCEKTQEPQTCNPLSNGRNGGSMGRTLACLMLSVQRFGVDGLKIRSRGGERINPGAHDSTARTDRGLPPQHIALAGLPQNGALDAVCCRRNKRPAYQRLQVGRCGRENHSLTIAILLPQGSQGRQHPALNSRRAVASHLRSTTPLKPNAPSTRAAMAAGTSFQTAS